MQCFADVSRDQPTFKIMCVEPGPEVDYCAGKDNFYSFLVWW